MTKKIGGRRTEELWEIQKEGYTAALAGKERDSCPYQYRNGEYWLKGWDDGKREHDLNVTAEKQIELSDAEEVEQDLKG